MNIKHWLQQEISTLSWRLLLLILVLMTAIYFLPIWYIQMGGMQFMQPLSIYIWINKITGGTDVDLYTINDFNHYIGMKKIYPESIPELAYMPYILGYTLLGALVTLWHRRVYMLWLGLLNLFLVSFAGIWDFWRWLYNYGTDLDTKAPLYDKSVDFQPPIFACKEILNVTTCSWPHWGGVFLTLSISLLIFILFLEYKRVQT